MPADAASRLILYLTRGVKWEAQYAVHLTPLVKALPSMVAVSVSYDPPNWVTRTPCLAFLKGQTVLHHMTGVHSVTTILDTIRRMSLG